MSYDASALDAASLATSAHYFTAEEADYLPPDAPGFGPICYEGPALTEADRAAAEEAEGFLE